MAIVPTSFGPTLRNWIKGQDLASGSTLTLGTDGNTFDVTGSTQISFITTSGLRLGHVILLKFEGAPNLNHNASSPPANTASLLLAGDVDFPTSAGNIIELWYDGTNWREITRNTSSGTGGGSSAVAGWSMTQVRYFLLDYDGGSDSNDGYIDAAAGSTLSPAGIALKTIERLHQIFPRFGNGRMAVVLVKLRAAGATYRNQADTADDEFNFNGVTGYSYLLVRGSTDLSNDATDRLTLGAMVATAGPNGDSSFTASAGTVNTVTIAAGSFGATDANSGFRVRFKGNVTAALANVSRSIQQNTGTVVTLGRDLAVAPVVGDEFFIERPGVRVARFLHGGSGARVLLGSTYNEDMTNVAGIAMTATTTSGVFQIAVGGGYRIAFCDLVTSSTSIGFNTVTPLGRLTVTFTYLDETGAIRSVGGMRCAMHATLTAEQLFVGAFAGLPATGRDSFTGIDTMDVGSFGSYWVSAPQCFRGQTMEGPNSTTATSRFGTVSSLDRRTLIRGSAGALEFRQWSGQVSSVEFASSTSGAGCLRVQGTGSNVVIDDIVGTSGNTDVGFQLGAECSGCIIVLGRRVVNSVAGTAGEIRLNNNILTTHAAFTITNLVDDAGNNIIGTGLSVTGQSSIIINSSGATLAVGDVLRSNGTSGQATSAQADAAANASVIGFALTPNASAADGYMTTGPYAWANFDGAPTAGAIAYLSPGTARNLTTTIPALAGTNQKLRVGRVVRVSGTRGYIYVSQENLSVLADGLA